MTVPFIPRPSQREILKYRRGMLGISAVPGSGKTQTLSALAARIILSGELRPDQEVLIVTLVNSAVDNFAGRIGGFVKARGQIRQLGYRVRTLHGLAHDIVREDPPLVSLDKKFSIIDETASSTMIHDAARAYSRGHPELRDAYLAGGLSEGELRRVDSKNWPELLEGLAAAFIRSAKDRRLTPEGLREAADRQPTRLPLLEMGLQIYTDYQRALVYRGAVDFDDLIRLASQMLEASPELLDRLRHRWPYILEDEAQDSSELQQAILSMLAGEGGNWVRVGDPNQAIFETFTTADPRLLLEFIAKHPRRDMPESGRCQPSIMNLANFLIEWVMNQHPVPAARAALTPPWIKPAPAGDPQPNPADEPAGIVFLEGRFTPEQEVTAVVLSIAEWLPGHPEETVAVLSSTNDHAARVAEGLKRRAIPYVELLRSTSPTRAAAGALSYVLTYLSSPDSSSKLAAAYRVWRRDWRRDPERDSLVVRAAGVISRLRNIEDFVAPTAALPSPDAGGQEAQDGVPARPVTAESETAEINEELNAFRSAVDRWHSATILPIDQLVLTISQEIFTEPADLALAHKLALVMRQLADENPKWRLAELVPGLHEIARNERRFIGFSRDDSGFDPSAYKGKVVVSTMHKAKGLEWDRVYLMSVNDYDYPSAQPNDHFISERWHVRDELNLEAEALEQLEIASSPGPFRYYEEGQATRTARLDYVRERLRLLFVGITRARRELVISWNTGRRGDSGPSLPLVALEAWWHSRLT